MSKRGESQGALLIPLDENETTATVFESNLKQALFNTDQDDGH